jgi:hypothetical protein
VNRIKKLSKTILSWAAGAAIGIGGLVSTANASVYTVDNFLFSADLKSSGDALETSTLEDWLKANGTNITVTLDDKNNVPQAQKDDAGNWYFDIAPDEPGYFLVKFGTGKSGLPDHYYFENTGELTKLVFTDEQVSGLIGTGSAPMALSHYVIFNNDPDGGGGGGGGGNVPEPGSLALAGFGLVAVARAKRRTRA